MKPLRIFVAVMVAILISSVCIALAQEATLVSTAPVTVDPKVATGFLQSMTGVFNALKTRDSLAVLVALCNLLIAALKSPMFQKFLNRTIGIVIKWEWKPGKKQKIALVYMVGVGLAWTFYPELSVWIYLWKGLKIALMAMGIRSFYKHYVEVPLNGNLKEA